MEFWENDRDYNWREISENPDKEHYSKSSITQFIEIYSYLIDELKRIGKEEDYEDLSFVRKLVKITTNGYKVIKSKMKQSEVLSQKDIKCPICNSNKIALMKGNGEEIIGCDIIGIICHDCEKIFKFSDIKYKNVGDNDDRKSFN